MKSVSLKTNKTIILIFIIGFFVRTLFISRFPAGFTPDEASFGYDAYSLLQTGKDQWGKQVPLVLESFGDFKPPLYAYILMPFVNVFGLREFSVRLPNALLGSFSILVMYFLFREFSKKERGGKTLGLVSAFLLSVSSWHVMMSRGAFEANLSTFFIPLAVLLFLKGLKNPKFLIFSSIVFGLNMFSYHAAKIVTPLIFFSVITLWLSDFLSISRKYKTLFLGIFVFFLMLTMISFSQGAGARAADLSVLSGAQEEAAAPRLALIQSGTSETVAKAIHNQYTVATLRFFTNYKQYFSYTFLFKNGPSEATYGMIPGRGVLYIFEIIALVGFAAALLKKEFSRLKMLFVIWLLVGPLPAALAQGVGYAGNRAVVMLPAYIALLAYGFEFLLRKGKDHYPRYLKLFTSLFVGVYVYSFSVFVLDYFVTLPLQHADAMLFGRREALQYVNENNKTQGSVVVSTSLSEPHIYVAFYGEIDPTVYQKESKNWEVYKEMNLKFLDQLPEYHLQEFAFIRNVNEYEEPFEYLIVKPHDLENEISPEKTIQYPNGEDALYIIKGNQNYYAKTF